MTDQTPPDNDSLPPVLSVRRDSIHREVRLELADWRTRTGGVYDLPGEDQEALLLFGHLPPFKPFLPDFVIVYGTGEPVTVSTPDGPVESVEWTDLRVHVGGPGWASVQRDLVSSARPASSTEWHDLDALLNGNLRVGDRTAPAPDWLLDLIRTETPFGHLLGPDAEPEPAHAERPAPDTETVEPASRERLLDDAVGLLLHSLDEGCGGVEDGKHSHTLTYATDGDGWNEPHSLIVRCGCDTWDGIEWMQVDPECTDRPSDVDVVLAWRAHVLTALGEETSILYPGALVCEDCQRPVRALLPVPCGDPTGGFDREVCAACHPDSAAAAKGRKADV